MEIKNIISELNHTKFDESVGISICTLISDKIVSTYATKIAPKKGVNPHFHKHGNESYTIISGKGLITLTDVNTHDQQIFYVSSGDVFTISPNIEHSLINTSDSESLILLFSCPPEHLNNDRYFTEKPTNVS